MKDPKRLEPVASPPKDVGPTPKWQSRLTVAAAAAAASPAETKTGAPESSSLALPRARQTSDESQLTPRLLGKGMAATGSGAPPTKKRKLPVENSQMPKTSNEHAES